MVRMGGMPAPVPQCPSACPVCDSHPNCLSLRRRSLPPSRPYRSCGSQCTTKRCPAYALFVLGVVALVVCTTITIYCDLNPLTAANATNSTGGGGANRTTAAATAAFSPGLSYPSHGPFTYLY